MPNDWTKATDSVAPPDVIRHAGEDGQTSSFATSDPSEPASHTQSSPHPSPDRATKIARGDGRPSERKRSKSEPRTKQELTKVSANFVNRALAALEIASEITGDNQTDVINRSVQVYAYIMKMMDEGKLIFVEDPKTGAKERLILL